MNIIDIKIIFSREDPSHRIYYANNYAILTPKKVCLKEFNRQKNYFGDAKKIFNVYYKIRKIDGF